LTYRSSPLLCAKERLGHPLQMKPRIAVLIPCYNESLTVGKVIQDFRTVLPSASIYVCDNNSTDCTVEAARSAGAVISQETLQGKGHVIRRMFRDVDADFYLMVDGDDTYDASVAPQMLKLAESGHDLVNCIRKGTDDTAYRPGHRWGNTILTGIVRQIFGSRLEDALSGYKVFSRRFVKSFPAAAQGFDIETELTIHALELVMPIAHLHGSYKGRPAGSESKLHTYRDGWRILLMIVRLVRHERPLLFFGTIAGLLATSSVIISVPLALTYLETGLVPRLPTAVLSTGMMLLAALSWFAGIILDTVTRGRREVRLLAYLQQKPFDVN
jgi:glycosyltransferase involved in cell wall biosynthesis